MEIKLKRYYGDEKVTKSVMEVWMEGEEEPRLVCEAREVGFRDYEDVFNGASNYCMPEGRWRMACGRGPYSPMGVRVVKCPGHRQVFFGYAPGGRALPDRVMMGRPVYHYYTDEDGHEVEYPPKRGMKDGEEVFGELDALLYEAFGRGEEMWCEVDNEAPSCPSSARALASVASDSATFSCPVSPGATPKGEGSGGELGVATTI